MRDLTSEDEDFLVKYCMEPENTWLALAIGQIQTKLERRIVSSFLKKLDKSVERELKERERGLHWRTNIPKEDLEEEDLKEDFSILYVMTMEDQVEIHLALWRWNRGNKDRELYVGTHKEIGNRKVPWSKDKLAGFLSKPDIMQDNGRHWWFPPTKRHRYIKDIKDLSTLNDDKLRCEKIAYFTDVLVRFADTISEELGA